MKKIILVVDKEMTGAFLSRQLKGGTK